MRRNVQIAFGRPLGRPADSAKPPSRETYVEQAKAAAAKPAPPPAIRRSDAPSSNTREARRASWAAVVAGDPAAVGASPLQPGFAAPPRHPTPEEHRQAQTHQAEQRQAARANQTQAQNARIERVSENRPAVESIVIRPAGFFYAAKDLARHPNFRPDGTFVLRVPTEGSQATPAANNQQANKAPVAPAPAPTPVARTDGSGAGTSAATGEQARTSQAPSGQPGASGAAPSSQPTTPAAEPARQPAGPVTRSRKEKLPGPNNPHRAAGATRSAGLTYERRRELMVAARIKREERKAARAQTL